MREQEMEVREPDALERALAKALERVDAPEGFAERVMERALAKPTHDDGAVMNGAPGGGEARLRTGAQVVTMRSRFVVHGRAWVGGAMAAVLVLGAFGAEQMHVRREREALANRQFEAAVLVTDQALQQTREQLAKAGLKLVD